MNQVQEPPLVCPLCKEEPVYKVEVLPGTMFTAYNCNNCGVLFWWPMKNPGFEWYERDERYAGRNHEPLLLPNWNHRKVISFLKNKTGKVLDIGCGTGNFLAHAKEQGWDPYGIDFDRDAIATSKEVFHLNNTFVSDLPHYIDNSTKNTFDLVTFFDVFEHIDNHNEFISLIKEILKDKGHIAMSMPYRKGARWLQPHDLPPRHLTRWDEVSIRKFLERNGFKVRYLARRSEGISFLILKLRFRYGKYTSFNLVSKLRKVFEREGGKVELGSTQARTINTASKVARIKDTIIFGIPAFVVWLAMLFTPKRYITLYVIAEKQ